MLDPSEIASGTVRSVMGVGSAKDGCDESWRFKPCGYHLGKAARHGAVAFLMYSGLMPADAEGWLGHARNALTRLSMALSVA